MCSLNITGVLYNLIMALKLAHLKKKHKKAWEKYEKLNNQMTEVILRDFINETGIKLDSEEK